MSVNAKHMATFLLGAAAGYGAYKYSKLSDEEKDKLHADLKAKEYFEELRTKGGGALKDHLADAENLFNELFGNKKSPDPEAGAK